MNCLAGSFLRWQVRLIKPVDNQWQLIGDILSQRVKIPDGEKVVGEILRVADLPNRFKANRGSIFWRGHPMSGSNSVNLMLSFVPVRELSESFPINQGL